MKKLTILLTVITFLVILCNSLFAQSEFKVTKKSTGDTQLIIKDDGKVGIGTSEPLVELDLRSTSMDNAAVINLANMNDSRSFWLSGGEGALGPGLFWLGDYALRFITHDGQFNELMRLSGTGFLGLGTVDPQAKLDIQLSNNGDWERAFRGLNPDMVSGNRLSLVLGRSDDMKNTAQMYFWYDGNASDANRFSLGLFGASDAINILGSGNVGIGTINPGSLLEVAGTIYSTTGGFKFPDGSEQISAAGSGGTASNTLDQAYDQSGAGAGRTIIADAGAVNIIGSGGLTISDKVGIGTTNPLSILSVGGDGNTNYAIYGETSSSTGRGVHGYASNSGNVINYGGFFQADGSSGRGIYAQVSGISARGVTGVASNTNTGTNYGGYFMANSTSGYGIFSYASGSSGRGVYGYASNTGSATNYGGYFRADGSDGYGVYGYASNTGSVTNYGGYFRADGSDGYGVYGTASGSSGQGVYGTSSGSSGRGVYGYASNTGSAQNFGGYFKADGTYGIGVSGSSSGIYGYGVTGWASNSGFVTNYGGYFLADGNSGRGVYGEASGRSGIGVMGVASNNDEDIVNIGGYFLAEAGAHSGSCKAVYAYAENGYSGYFAGRVSIIGQLDKGSGAFKIDHPLDPENKYLYHSFVESPDMMNIYNGNVITDANGFTNIQLPEWFEALNKEFRYQLTVIGEFAQAIVYEKVNNNQFTIKTDKPNVEVSWQVTGIRKDAFANANRIPVEENKEEKERGKYLYPEAFNMPKTVGIDYDERIRIKNEQKAEEIRRAE